MGTMEARHEGLVATQAWPDDRVSNTARLAAEAAQAAERRKFEELEGKLAADFRHRMMRNGSQRVARFVTGVFFHKLVTVFINCMLPEHLNKLPSGKTDLDERRDEDGILTQTTHLNAHILVIHMYVYQYLLHYSNYILR